MSAVAKLCVETCDRESNYWPLITGHWPLVFMLYDITIDGKKYRLDLNRADGRWSCRLDGRDLEVDASSRSSRCTLAAHREHGV